jgi:hypothetical protein
LFAAQPDFEPALPQRGRRICLLVSHRGLPLKLARAVFLGHVDRSRLFSHVSSAIVDSFASKGTLFPAHAGLNLR